MRTKKKTEITVETDQVLIIRQRRSGVRAWCDGCAQPVKLVTAEEAATVAGVSTRTIYRWVEAEKVHFTETPDGSLLICLNSLLKKQ
jgi:hypothetical protein